MDVPALKPEEVELLLFPMLNKEQRRKLEQDWELDFSYGVQGLGRFRVNIYKDRGNYAAAFRVIASKVPSFLASLKPEIPSRRTAGNLRQK